MLEDIGGVRNAVFQTFVPPGAESPSTLMSSLIDEVSGTSIDTYIALDVFGFYFEL